MTPFAHQATLCPMQIFAHRGAAGRGADENSLEAIRRAVALGVGGIEVDIRRTRDDEAVLVHDSDLRRIAGDIRQVAELSLDEIQAIPLRHGTRVITLDELTANVPAPIALDLEVKDQEALDLMIRKLRTSAGLRERTMISSFAEDVIERASHELPEIRLVLLARNWPRRWKLFKGWAAAHRLHGFGLVARQWSPGRVAKVHEMNIRAVAWELFAVSRSVSARAARLRALGVDMAIVNQPGIYLQRP